MKKSFIRLVTMLLVVAMLAAMPVVAFAADHHTHTFESDGKKNTSCSADKFVTLSYTVMKCSCGYTWKSSYKIVEHNFNVTKKDMDDGTKDFKYVFTCADCGYSYTGLKLSKDCSAHEYREETITDPTCDKPGYSVLECINCGEKIVGNKVSRLAEDFADHAWGAWTVTKEATTEAKGEEERTCSKCGLTDTCPVKKLARTYKTGYITGAELVNLYSDHPGTSKNVVGLVTKGTKINVDGFTDDGLWCRTYSSNAEDPVYWISTKYVNFNSQTSASAYAHAVAYGSVNSGISLKVHNGYTASSAEISSLAAGTSVAIYAFKNDANTGDKWALISETEQKWVLAKYLTYLNVLLNDFEGVDVSKLPSTNKTESSTKVIATGVVSSNIPLNVRSTPKVALTNLVGTIATGTKVNIYKMQDANGASWGYVNQGGVKGWVCMNYVVLDSSSSSSGSSSSSSTATPNASVVNCATGVNVREKADVTSKLLSTIAVGSRIAITKVSGRWGYVSGRGWVCMDYVQMDAGALDALNKKPSSTKTETETALPTYTNVKVTAKVNTKSSVYQKTDGAKEVLQLVKNTEITILDRTKVNGEDWGKVTIGNITGWVKIDGTNISLPAVTGTVAVSSLNVYKADNRDSEVLTSLSSGTTIMIAENGQSVDGTYIWGYIAKLNGYVQLHNVNLDVRTLTDSGCYSVGSVAITGKISDDTAPMRKTPSTSADSVLNLSKDTKVTINEWVQADGKTWGKVTVGGFSGWVNMAKVTQDAVKCTVTADSVNLYGAADLTGPVELVLRSGETVSVTERQLDGTRVIGKITRNKVTYYANLSGLGMGDAAASTTTPTTPSTPATPSTPTTTSTPGTVVNADQVNVRSAAGTRNQIVTTVKRGSAVTVYEQTTVDNAPWGRIDQGWICLYYVNLGTTPVSTGTVTTGGTTTTIMTSVPSGAVAVGFVNSKTLNIRSGAYAGASQTGSLNKGANVVIYEQVLHDGVIWGRIDQGWICTSFVTLTAIGSTGSGTAGVVARCNYTANVRSVAGIGGALVGKVMVNSRVEVYETTTYSGETWGRTAIGWISMQYVSTDTIPVV